MLLAYEAVLKKSPNRFNSLYGAGRATEKPGDIQKTIFYYMQLSTAVGATKSDRPELADIHTFLAIH